MLKFRTHGKWILAGEHSVLRGGTALVFPVQSRFLDFSFQEGGEGLTLSLEKPDSNLEVAFWGVLEKALQNLGMTRSQISGQIGLSSNIPVGAGMGASATLCVSLAKWLANLGFLGGDKQYEFAKNLENLFHGESSGVDVAVALNNQALEFTKPNTMKVFLPSWNPAIYLSYCGKKGVTSDCVARVQELIKKDPLRGQEIDQQMSEAVSLAKKALSGEKENFKTLIQAFNLGKKCFEDWGLISRSLEEHMNWLTSQGAVAVKPTGSGEGGFVLSLWTDEQIPQSATKDLIKA